MTDERWVLLQGVERKGGREGELCIMGLRWAHSFCFCLPGDAKGGVGGESLKRGM